MPGYRWSKPDYGLQRDLHELRKMKKHFEGADVLLRVNPETVKVLQIEQCSWLTESEELCKNILVKSDATLASGAVRYSGMNHKKLTETLRPERLLRPRCLEPIFFV